MEFTNLKENFRNTYPTTGSYSTSEPIGTATPLPSSFSNIREKISKNGFKYSDLKIRLQGVYPQNSLFFDKVSLDEKIITVPNTEINFVVKIIYDGEIVLFTSPTLLKKLQATYQGSNPYNVLSRLSEVVEIDIEPYVLQILNDTILEKQLDVTMNLNLFVRLDSESNIIDLDLNKLIEYINWVVSKPSRSIESDVLDVNEISDYTYPIKIEPEVTGSKDDESSSSSSSSSAGGTPGGNDMNDKDIDNDSETNRGIEFD